MNPDDPRNERAHGSIWVKNGYVSPLWFGKINLICRTCGASPETCTLESERTSQTFRNQKPYFPALFFTRNMGYTALTEFWGHRCANPSSKTEIGRADGNWINLTLPKLYNSLSNSPDDGNAAGHQDWRLFPKLDIKF